MYIHYSPDGDYRAISNFRMKNLRRFLREYHFIDFICYDVNLENIKIPEGIKVSFNVETLLYLINLDCDNCPKKSECNHLFPLDIILELDGTFNVINIICFVDGELTRLINYYGRYGHFFHCIDMDLLNNPWYKHKEENQCDKSKCFLKQDYYYAVMVLRDRIIKIFGEKLYDKLRSSLILFSSQKHKLVSKTLFEVR